MGDSLSYLDNLLSLLYTLIESLVLAILTFLAFFFFFFFWFDLVYNCNSRNLALHSSSPVRIKIVIVTYGQL